MMNIEKKNLLQIIKEEVAQIAANPQLSKADLTDIVDRLLHKLDSIDMSLDLIYGAVAGSTEPIAVTRARQRALGRASRPIQREPTPPPAPPPVMPGEKS